MKSKGKIKNNWYFFFLQEREKEFTKQLQFVHIYLENSINPFKVNILHYRPF